MAKRYDDDGLTERERDVLLLVAHGFSNRVIAADMEVSVKTVETFRLRGMAKLRLESRADLVRYAIDRGWLKKKLLTPRNPWSW